MKSIKICSETLVLSSSSSFKPTQKWPWKNHWQNEQITWIGIAPYTDLRLLNYFCQQLYLQRFWSWNLRVRILQKQEAISTVAAGLQVARIFIEHFEFRNRDLEIGLCEHVNVLQCLRSEGVNRAKVTEFRFTTFTLFIYVNFWCTYNNFKRIIMSYIIIIGNLPTVFSKS